MKNENFEANRMMQLQEKIIELGKALSKATGQEAEMLQQELDLVAEEYRKASQAEMEATETALGEYKDKPEENYLN